MVTFDFSYTAEDNSLRNNDTREEKIMILSNLYSLAISLPLPSLSLSPSPPLSLLSSAMSSDRNKELFLQQVQQILDGIKQDKEQLLQRCLNEKKEKDSLNKSYLELIEQQRAYYKAVKDFQEVI